MKKLHNILRTLFLVALTLQGIMNVASQTSDTLYIYHQGTVVFKRSVQQIDSMSYSKPVVVPQAQEGSASVPAFDTLYIHHQKSVVLKRSVHQIDSMSYSPPALVLPILASVTTGSPTTLTATSVTLSGTITSDGGAAITARGIVWSTTPNPTIALSTKSIEGSGTGTFTSTLTGLAPATTYYARAYATNSAGTAYGEEISFTTTAASTVSTVTSTTGKVWMDRNLGASRVATSSTDAESYGDLYQWGRGTDGHEKRNSLITSTLSDDQSPSHGHFIAVLAFPNDWLSIRNDDLWQGVSRVNNPCPSNFRVPTIAEWNAEISTWSTTNADGAFLSTLKLPVGGIRYNYNGEIGQTGTYGHYWSSTIEATTPNIKSLYFHHTINNNGYYPGNLGVDSSSRSNGFSLRCIKD